MKLVCSLCCECLHQGETSNWLNLLMEFSQKQLIFVSLCNWVTIYDCVRLSCVENKRTVLSKHWGSHKWMRECLCSYNRYIVLWLWVHAQKHKWNRLLSILDEFHYSGACEMGWEVQLRGNFMYWTQRGDHKTHTHTHIVSIGVDKKTIFFCLFSKIKMSCTKMQRQILAL